MKKTLIVSGHTRLSHSAANRAILEQLVDLPNVAVTDVRTNYPEGQIDVAAEQEGLREASLIILQFPFIWYGMPAHMRSWMEAVFAHGFAYGEGGGALRNKRLLLSITLGGSKEAYSNNGQHRHPVESFLRPLEMFAAYCGMIYLPPVYSYDMANSNEGGNDLPLKIALHVHQVTQIIYSMDDAPIGQTPLLYNQSVQ